MENIISDCWAHGFGFVQTWEIVRRKTGKCLSKALYEKVCAEWEKKISIYDPK
jgi:hypothetical protein